MISQREKQTTTMSDNKKLNSSSSSDEISQFLQHMLNRSSSPLLPSYYSPTTTVAYSGDPHAETSTRFVSSPQMLTKRAAGSYGFSGGQGSSSGTTTTTTRVLSSGNETDEYDCESEEGVEAVVDEVPCNNKSGPSSSSRSSSKRCRAAEVHNLSEKRRRSRINEKMKALQSLIPNSNKTDKASMLDEAIEYLKQLQLQVQMLTMRNGINLHPLCLPGTALHPLQLAQIRPTIPQEATNDPMLNHTQFASTSNAPEMIAPSYPLEPSLRGHFGPFPLLNSSVDMSREGGLAHQRMDIGHSNANLSGEQGVFGGQQTDLKDRLT